MTEYEEYYPDTLTGVLRRGDSGVDVKLLQTLLNEHDFYLTVDGVFGKHTYNAVTAIQRRFNLVVDGIVGAKTLSVLNRRRDDPRLLSQEDLVYAANVLEVELAVVMALSHVESRGNGFLACGKPVILFERHVFNRRLKHHGVNTDPYLVSHPEVVNTRMGGYKGGISEYTRLEQAMGIHKEAALESASWGSYQIMGFHWSRLGYKSIDEFVGKMYLSEREHLEALVRFIRNEPRLHKAMQSKSWSVIARLYNGPAYANHTPPYDVRLQEAYGLFS